MKKKKVSNDLTRIKQVMRKEEGSVYKWLRKYNWRSATIWEWEMGERKPTIVKMKSMAKDLYGKASHWMQIAQYF